MLFTVEISLLCVNKDTCQLSAPPFTAEARRQCGKRAASGAHARIILEERVNIPLSFW